MYKYVIFDFDGTVVSSRLLAVQLFNEFSHKYGYRQMREEEIEELAALSIKDRLQALGCPMYKLPMLLLDMKKKYKQDVMGLEAVEGIRETLLALKQMGVTVGILSSNHEENIQAFLRQNDLPGFDFVMTASNLFGKDRAIGKLLKAQQLAKDAVLYVGDELRDVEACGRIGVACAAVTWGFDAEGLLRQGKPRYLLHQPAEICTVVSGAAG